ncbi:hypothetical protein [Winogradskyella sp.]|uniref:hypothetical protein n=1 Tax=Winogradskyella sp. TaxID=1883156 RepID=UPI00261D8931|nr:hypothetical protein [Winogradskyella sp.]
MKKVLILVLALSITSCIPYKIAPKFKKEDYKVMKAKKFQRKLPNETSFIFKDPKDAYEFYNYLNKKYNLENKYVGVNTPFQINNETYYLSYSEVERTDETLNLPLIVIDAKREQNGNSALFVDGYTSRKGHWYLVITVYDEELNNCLLDKHPIKPLVLKYLIDLKHEYLTTHNYEELLFVEKS